MIGKWRGAVGVEWSTVPKVKSGRRTLIPRSRSPLKACGEVTSWTRWRSMNRSDGAPSRSVTMWLSHTFSIIVRGLDGICDCVSYLGCLGGGALRFQVGSHVTAVEHFFDRGIDGRGLRDQAKAVFEHRRHRADGAERIGLVHARNIRRRTVHRFI